MTRKRLIVVIAVLATATAVSLEVRSSTDGRSIDTVALDRAVPSPAEGRAPLVIEPGKSTESSGYTAEELKRLAAEHATLTPEQRDAKYKEIMATSAADRANWLESDEARQVIERINKDVNSVEHAQTMISWLSSVGTFEQVANTSDNLLIGTVERISFELDKTIVHLKVERDAKGTVIQGTSVALVLAGGLYRSPTGKPYLAIAEAMPPHDVGTRLAVLAKQIGPDRYSPLPFAGFYKLVDGAAIAQADNQLTDRASLSSESALFAAARAAFA